MPLQPVMKPQTLTDLISAAGDEYNIFVAQEQFVSSRGDAFQMMKNVFDIELFLLIEGVGNDENMQSDGTQESTGVVFLLL